MKLLAIVGVGVALGLAGPVFAADQFDLICKGTQNNAMGGPDKPFEVRYRIDLAAKRWCQNECVGAGQIAEITPDLIYLEKDEVSIRRGLAPDYHHYISRATGHAVSFVAGSLKTSTTCEPAPFSGMPTPKF